VILFDCVVQIGRQAAAASSTQFARFLQFGDGGCICRVAINIDDARFDWRRTESELQKAFCGGQIAIGRQQEINRVPGESIALYK
jgi:hypothetical protein